MTEKQRLNEEHDSARLAGFMEASTDPKPHKLCHCHAIVSGSHGEAAAARAVMAWLSMRIDDPRNGCWLPANTKARESMPERLRNAIPHSRIHRKTYYRWLDENISFTLTDSIEALASKLKMVRVRLQSGSVPPVILLDLGYKT